MMRAHPVRAETGRTLKVRCETPRPPARERSGGGIRTKVFVAGATGVLGRRITTRLVRDGHQVTGMVRSDEGARILEGIGGTSVRADIFDSGSLARAAVGSEAIVHAATSIPRERRPTASDFQINDRLRTEGNAALLGAAEIVGAGLYLYQSIVWLARPEDGASFDERAPTSSDPALRASVEGERLVREAAGRKGMNTAILRCGWFYSADGFHTREMGMALRRRSLPIIGSGENYQSMVHPDDAASAFTRLVEQPRDGLWHVVDDRPVRMAELLQRFAKALGAPPPRRIPAWLARLAAGSSTVDFLTSSVRTSADRFKSETGWKPSVPDVEAGLRSIVGEWATEGFPPR